MIKSRTAPRKRQFVFPPYFWPSTSLSVRSGTRTPIEKKHKDTSKKEMVSWNSGRLLAKPPSKGRCTFLSGVASSVIYYTTCLLYRYKSIHFSNCHFISSSIAHSYRTDQFRKLANIYKLTIYHVLLCEQGPVHKVKSIIMSLNFISSPIS